MKILVTVPMDSSGLDSLKALADTDVDLMTDISEERLRDVVSEYEVLIAGTTTPVSPSVIDQAKRLRLICLMGMGQPVLDLDAATRKGILVGSAPDSVAVSVAEHALSLVMALARRIPRADSLLKRGVWGEKELIGTELQTKTLGIIGFGAVGRLVAERAKGMKMEVLVYDPHLSAEAVNRKGCTSVSSEELFSKSDLISIHAPLNPETRELVDESSISLMKPGVLLINCSASEVLNEDAVYAAIMSGKVAGVAMDLHREEPIEEHPLYLSDKVICTPNLSIYTQEAVISESMKIARQVASYGVEGQIPHAVNLPESEDSRTDRGRRWNDLGEALGKFIIQLHPYGLKQIEIDLAGEEGLPSVESFTRSVLKGILGQVIGDTVNLVNARSLAHERGIHVLEKRQSSAETYRTCTTVTIDTDQGRGSVSGTLFDDMNSRLVRVDDYELEAMPDGDFLVILNRDRPGVIADVGETLGKYGINIGQMYNGRDMEGGKAMTLIRIDSPVSHEALTEIQGLPNVLKATGVNMT